MTLRLPRLPDRTPVKLVLAISPGLQEALTAYAAQYEQHYGQAEAIAALVLAMLEAFLASDRDFQATRKRGT